MKPFDSPLRLPLTGLPAAAPALPAPSSPGVPVPAATVPRLVAAVPAQRGLHELSGSRLTADELDTLLAAAALVPAYAPRRLRMLRVGGGGVEVVVPAGGASGLDDPEQRGLYLTCGAAVFNLRLAMAALGYSPRASVVPHEVAGDLVARVTPGPRRVPTAMECALYATLVAREPVHSAVSPPAAAGGRTPARPALAPYPISVGDRLTVQAAARAELGWLLYLDRSTADAVASLVRKAETSMPGTHVRRTLLAAEIRQTLSAHSPETGVLAVLGTTSDWPVDRVWAGQAAQRVVLSAATRSLRTLVMARPFALPAFSTVLCRQLRVAGAAQLLVRVGYPATAGP